ncbi:colicin V synthesis protein [Coxiella endosymbiont of Amblyomma sculptum]|uniref:CvpA family protein n=1 Tax=Coxiella endosymbiont of Amblyomma sculptum TaxID=2487929 RepID=UPI00132EB511|nr:CvpA family protein [Coxiella endosymbiont of Amblyomma sculptum]QHG92558.1 colicin V synthesis protein [Coxiella endosymbiont of Amblyomma sculptum]
MNFGIVSCFNWIDFSIVGTVFLSIVVSFFRGFVRESISLIVWIFAVIVAFKFSEPVQVFLHPWIGLGSLRYAIAFGVLFLAVLISGAFINSMMCALVKKIDLTITDRLLGIFFGAGRGLFIVAILLTFFGIGGIEEEKSAIAQSQLAPKFEPIAMWLHQFVPSQIGNILQWLEEASSN